MEEYGTGWAGFPWCWDAHCLQTKDMVGVLGCTGCTDVAPASEDVGVALESPEAPGDYYYYIQ